MYSISGALETIITVDLTLLANSICYCVVSTLTSYCRLKGSTVGSPSDLTLLDPIIIKQNKKKNRLFDFKSCFIVNVLKIPGVSVVCPCRVNDVVLYDNKVSVAHNLVLSLSSS